MEYIVCHHLVECMLCDYYRIRCYAFLNIIVILYVTNKITLKRRQKTQMEQLKQWQKEPVIVSLKQYNRIPVINKRSVPRSTPRAQTSAAPSLKSVKQSLQAWSSVAYCSFCVYPANSMKYPFIRYSVMLATNIDLDNRKRNPVSKGLKQSSPKHSRLFLVS